MRQRTGAYLVPGVDIRLAVELAGRAEAWGYESLWVTHGGGRDAFLLLPFYRAMLTASGFGETLAAFDRERGQASSPAHAVPDELAAALGGIGDECVVRAYAAAYRQAGVTLPAIRPIGFPDAPHFRPTLQAFAV